MNNNYYEQEELWNRELTLQETERIDIVKKFIPNDVKTILDAGCGNGAISNYLDGFNITAMDRSHEALKYVKNKSVEGSLDSLPFGDNSFDLIICSDVLEHLPDDIYKKTIKEFKRVSKKYILIISPNAEELEANQSKCIKCGTVFHMNWHISSISVDKILNNFRDDFSPVYYSFFGDKWASDPQIKYTLARTTSRGYKHWENAVCPMCSTTQKGSQENSKDIDIECNRFLNGFYNHSTEFIVLLSTIENKKEIFDFDDIEESILLSQKQIENLSYANRQSIISKHNIFTKKHTEFYPQYAYLVDDASSNEQNRRLVCFPYLKNSQKIYFEFQDNHNANILVNVYDLKKHFISIGTINLSSDNQVKKISFEIPDDIIPANEGLIFELISDNDKVFEEFVFDKIYIGDDFGDVTFSEQKEVGFFANKYLAYKYDYAKKDDCFLVLGKDVLVYDEKNRCFFMNLYDSFEFFVSSKNSKQELDSIKEELSKQSNTSKQELDSIKEELSKQSNTSKQELDSIKEELSKQSNTSKQELDSIKEELSKQSNTSKQELDSIKEELSKQSNTSNEKLTFEIEILKEQLHKMNQEINQLKIGVYNISNSYESLINKFRNPAKTIIGKIKKRLLYMNKLNYETHKNNLLKISEPENIYDKWFGNKKFIMICHDQVIDRRIIEQYKTLLKNGWDNGIIIGFSFNDEDHIENKDGVIIHRIGLKRIIPTEILYWQYQKREVIIHNLNIAKKLLGKINFIYYKLRIKNKFKGENVQDPLPFDNVFYNTGRNYYANLIVAHDLPALNASVKLSKDFNCKIVYDSHEMYSELNGFSKFQKNFLSEVESSNIKECDAVITVSETIALEFEKKYQVKKPSVIFSSYNLSNETKSSKSLYELANIDKKEKIMLFQGGISLDPNRNMKVLLKGFLEANIKQLHFVLLGPIEEKAKNMILKYSGNQYNKTVHILEAVNQSELLPLTATASFGVIPYKPLYQGDIAATGCLPNKFFEFMQAKLPILANEHLLEVKNILNEHGGGITYDMNDVISTAKAIKKMFESDLNQFKEDLNKNKFLFSWDNEEIKYLEIINRI